MAPKKSSREQTRFFRQWSVFLREARPWTDFLGLCGALWLFLIYAPMDLLNANPATGGDTASHFWPLVTFVKEGLPHWHVRVWNPGNALGEPHLTHYFPFPYFVMAFLSLFMPLGGAFNIGTFLPVLILPLSVYICFRGLKTRFPIPVLAAVASLSFLYNESFSMWGGNFLSTLAGQFAHMYAFNFLLLGIGAMSWEITRRRFSGLALLCFAGVMLSHFYIALLLPFVVIPFWLSGPTEMSRRERFIYLLKTCIGSIALAAWFVIPMVHNSKWNTAVSMTWLDFKFFRDAFPRVFWPYMVGGALLTGLVAWTSRLEGWREREWRVVPALIGSLALISAIFYFLFPKIGLVDVRVFPTLELLVCVWASVMLGLALRQNFPAPWRWFLTLPLMAVMIWWPTRQIVNLPYWLQWNYSGWEAKTAYPDLMKISDVLRGDFSQGRVLYESNAILNNAGTPRVFEMLPYFARRATLESVYLQSTIMVPAAYYVQALVSSTPSCPITDYQCTIYDLRRLPDYLQLLGITQLILVTQPVLDQVPTVDFLEDRGKFGDYHLFDSKLEAPLVETLKTPPTVSPKKDFKREFYDWFLNYRQGSAFLVRAPESDRERIVQAVDGDHCQPKVKVDFDRLDLETDCPGKFHVLKFAFHSTWKASTGDPLYLTSPGFIGIIPSSSKVSLIWGQHWLWTLSNAVSWLSLLILVGFWIRTRLNRKGDFP